jgi:hypothetical protein
VGKLPFPIFAAQISSFGASNQNLDAMRRAA